MKIIAAQREKKGDKEFIVFTYENGGKGRYLWDNMHQAEDGTFKRAIEIYVEFLEKK